MALTSSRRCIVWYLRADYSWNYDLPSNYPPNASVCEVSFLNNTRTLSHRTQTSDSMKVHCCECLYVLSYKVSDRTFELVGDLLCTNRVASDDVRLRWHCTTLGCNRSYKRRNAWAVTGTYTIEQKPLQFWIYSHFLRMVNLSNFKSSEYFVLELVIISCEINNMERMICLGKEKINDVININY
jgi:hypothetical protein